MITNIFPPYFKSEWFVMLAIGCGYVTAIVFPAAVSFFRKGGRGRLQRTQSMMSASSMNDTDRMDACVTSPETFDILKERCMRAWCVEIILFYREVLEFKNTFLESAPGDRNQRATDICDQFVVVDAPLWVNLTDDVQRRTLGEFARMDNVSEHVFDYALGAVRVMFKDTIYREWKGTTEYEKMFPRHKSLIGDGSVEMMLDF